MVNKHVVRIYRDQELAYNSFKESFYAWYSVIKTKNPHCNEYEIEKKVNETLTSKCFVRASFVHYIHMTQHINNWVSGRIIYNF